MGTLSVVAALVTTAPAAPALARTTYVVRQRDTRCSDGGPGTSARPFCTISAAADVAGAGDTVHVGAGTYREQVTVPSGARFVAGSRWAKVVGSGSRQYGFLVRDDHAVTVRGFTMRGQSGAGVLLDHSTDSVVRDVRVIGSASYGINVQDGSKDRIIRARVSHSASIGIRLLGTTSSSVTSSVSKRNGFHGISVQGGSGARVAGNVTSRNITPNVRRAAGIDVSSGSLNAVVERNVSHDNDDSGLEIYTGSTGAVVRRNVTYDNGDHGIDVSAAAKTTLVSNTSVGNSAAGLNVEGGSSGTTLRDNISVNDAIRSARSKGNIRVDAASVPGTSIDHDLAFRTGGAAPLFEWHGVLFHGLGRLRRATRQEEHGLAANPRFLALGRRNLQLGPASPALDRADSSVRGWAARDRTGARPVDDPRIRNRGKGPLRYADLGALERTPPTARLHLAHRTLRVGRPDRANASASTGTAHSHVVRYRFRCGEQRATRWKGVPTTTCTFHRPSRVRVFAWVRSNLGQVDRDVRWVRVSRR